MNRNKYGYYANRQAEKISGDDFNSLVKAAESYCVMSNTVRVAEKISAAEKIISSGNFKFDDDETINSLVDYCAINSFGMISNQQAIIAANLLLRQNKIYDNVRVLINFAKGYALLNENEPERALRYFDAVYGYLKLNKTLFEENFVKFIKNPVMLFLSEFISLKMGIRKDRNGDIFKPKNLSDEYNYILFKELFLYFDLNDIFNSIKVLFINSCEKNDDFYLKVTEISIDLYIDDATSRDDKKHIENFFFSLLKFIPESSTNKIFGIFSKKSKNSYARFFGYANFALQKTEENALKVVSEISDFSNDFIYFDQFLETSFVNGYNIENFTEKFSSTQLENIARITVESVLKQKEKFEIFVSAVYKSADIYSKTLKELVFITSLLENIIPFVDGHATRNQIQKYCEKAFDLIENYYKSEIWTQLEELDLTALSESHKRAYYLYLAISRKKASDKLGYARQLKSTIGKCRDSLTAKIVDTLWRML